MKTVKDFKILPTNVKHFTHETKVSKLSAQTGPNFQNDTHHNNSSKKFNHVFSLTEYMKIKIFWVVIPCRMINGYWSFKGSEHSALNCKVRQSNQSSWTS